MFCARTGIVYIICFLQFQLFNKITTYGGTIKYTVSYDASRGEAEQYSSIDIKIVVNCLIIILFMDLFDVLKVTVASRLFIVCFALYLVACLSQTTTLAINSVSR